MKGKNVFRWRQFHSFDGGSARIKGAKTGRIFRSHYSDKCLRLASEKLVLASESNLSLATVSPINVIKTINVIKIDHKCNTNHKCNNF